MLQNLSENGGKSKPQNKLQIFLSFIHHCDINKVERRLIGFISGNHLLKKNGKGNFHQNYYSYAVITTSALYNMR